MRKYIYMRICTLVERLTNEGEPRLTKAAHKTQDVCKYTHIYVNMRIYMRMCTLVKRSTKASPASPKQHKIRKIYIHTHISSQSHLECHFRKLKAQSSNVSFATFR